MTKQLARSTFVLMALACVAFAQTAPTYETFKPVFRTEVYILNEWAGADPAGAQNRGIQAMVPVNPSYALSETSALELMVVLAEFKPVLFHSGPFGWVDSGGFKSNAMVPWFKFPDGSATNAAFLAWYWSHGFPLSFLKMCVQQEMKGIAKMVEDGYRFDQIAGYPAN